jgi:hypothetical protein
LIKLGNVAEWNDAVVTSREAVGSPDLRQLKSAKIHQDHPQTQESIRS